MIRRIGLLAVLLLIGGACDRQSSESLPIVSMPSLVEDPFAWDGKEISIVGIFEYHTRNPRLLPVGREQLMGPFRYGVALEFDPRSDSVENYQHLDSHTVRISGVYYCVRDQNDACVLPMISNPNFL